MRKLLTSMIAGATIVLGTAGCIKEPDAWNEIGKAYSKVVAAYADWNNDGIVTSEEEARLKGDIAKANNLVYIERSNLVYDFRDKNGNFVTINEKIKMFNDYKPLK